jgi:hypothetical protein
MKRKLILAGVAVVAVVAGVVGMAAYEAHVINVTAHIENALKVLPVTKELEFGTVFPQEYRAKVITITTSQSFCESDQTRVLNVDYKIIQKPKPIWPIPELCEFYQVPEVSIEDMRVYCHDYPEDLDCCYPSLCPYLSKDPIDDDPVPYDDHGVPAFHDPNDPSSVASGTINKISDLQDDWIIDLAVPCFEGYCAQDWDEFVKRYNPEVVDPSIYQAEGDPNGTDFGCDLWVEVTAIY